MTRDYFSNDVTPALQSGCFWLTVIIVLALVGGIAWVVLG